MTGQFSQKNRFNKNLLSDIRSYSTANTNFVPPVKLGAVSEKGLASPEPLFGAINRLQPIGSSQLPNPFGISFEIPPLPNLDFFGGASEGSGFSFFSTFQRNPLPPPVIN
jgi:hypothetical protein